MTRNYCDGATVKGHRTQMDSITITRTDTIQFPKFFYEKNKLEGKACAELFCNEKDREVPYCSATTRTGLLLRACLTWPLPSTPSASDRRRWAVVLPRETCSNSAAENRTGNRPRRSRS